MKNLIIFLSIICLFNSIGAGHTTEPAKKRFSIDTPTPSDDNDSDDDIRYM